MNKKVHPEHEAEPTDKPGPDQSSVSVPGNGSATESGKQCSCPCPGGDYRIEFIPTVHKRKDRGNSPAMCPCPCSENTEVDNNVNKVGLSEHEPENMERDKTNKT